MKLKWLRKALENIDAQATYISQENPKYASQFVSKIFDAVKHLETFPRMGRAGKIEGTYELVVTGLPYVIVYRIRNEDIEILRVLHTSRKWPPSF